MLRKNWKKLPNDWRKWRLLQTQYLMLQQSLITELKKELQLKKPLKLSQYLPKYQQQKKAQKKQWRRQISHLLLKMQRNYNRGSQGKEHRQVVTRRRVLELREHESEQITFFGKLKNFLALSFTLPLPSSCLYVAIWHDMYFVVTFTSRLDVKFKYCKIIKTIGIYK